MGRFTPVGTVPQPRVVQISRDTSPGLSKLVDFPASDRRLCHYVIFIYMYLRSAWAVGKTYSREIYI